MAQTDVFIGRSRGAPRDFSVLWIVVVAVAALAAGFVSGTRVGSLGWVAAAIGGSVVLVTLARLEWSLLAIVVLTYTNLSEIATLNGAPPVSKVYVPLVLGIVLIRWFLKGERPGGSTSGFLAFAAYGLVSVFSASYAAYPDLVLSESTILAKNVVVALCVLAILTSGGLLRKTVWALVLSGAFLSAATIFQYLTGSYPVAVAGFARASVELIVIGTDNAWRHTGPLDDPNQYGQILVVLVPLAFERMANDRYRLMRIVAAVSLFLLLAGTLLTYSRGALLALACMSALFLVRYPGRLKILVPLVVAGLLIVQFAPPSYLARIGTVSALLPDGGSGGVKHQQEVDIAVEGRLGEMMVAVEMFLDNPIWGVGYQNYERYYQQYELRLNLPPRGQNRSAHSLFLEIAAEQGVVGLGAFGALIVLLIMSVVRSAGTFRRAGLPEYEQMATALGIALLGYGVTAIFLHNSYARYMWLLVGIVLSLRQIAAREAGERALPPEEAALGSPKTV